MEPDFDVPIADGQRSRSESHLSNSDEAMALRISQDYQEIRDGEDLVREYTAELAELAELAASRSGEADSSLSPAWHPSRPGAAASALTPITLPPAALAGRVSLEATPAELARAPARAPGRLTRKSVSMDNVGDALKGGMATRGARGDAGFQRSEFDGKGGTWRSHVHKGPPVTALPRPGKLERSKNDKDWTKQRNLARSLSLRREGDAEKSDDVAGLSEVSKKVDEAMSLPKHIPRLTDKEVKDRLAQLNEAMVRKERRKTGPAAEARRHSSNYFGTKDFWMRLRAMVFRRGLGAEEEWVRQAREAIPGLMFKVKDFTCKADDDVAGAVQKVGAVLAAIVDAGEAYPKTHSLGTDPKGWGHYLEDGKEEDRQQRDGEMKSLALEQPEFTAEGRLEKKLLALDAWHAAAQYGLQARSWLEGQEKDDCWESPDFNGLLNEFSFSRILASIPQRVRTTLDVLEKASEALKPIKLPGAQESASASMNLPDLDKLAREIVAFPLKILMKIIDARSSSAAPWPGCQDASALRRRFGELIDLLSAAKEFKEVQEERNPLAEIHLPDEFHAKIAGVAKRCFSSTLASRLLNPRQEGQRAGEGRELPSCREVKRACVEFRGVEMPKIIGALSIFRGNTFDCQDAVGKLQCSTIRRLLCIAHDLLQDACTRGEGVGEAAETCQEAVLAARTAYGDLGISCEFAVEDPAKMLQLLRESGKYEVLVDRSQQEASEGGKTPSRRRPESGEFDQTVAGGGGAGGGMETLCLVSKSRKTRSMALLSQTYAAEEVLGLGRSKQLEGHVLRLRLPTGASKGFDRHVTPGLSAALKEAPSEPRARTDRRAEAGQLVHIKELQNKGPAKSGSEDRQDPGEGCERLSEDELERFSNEDPAGGGRTKVGKTKEKDQLRKIRRKIKSKTDMAFDESTGDSFASDASCRSAVDLSTQAQGDTPEAGTTVVVLTAPTHFTLHAERAAFLKALGGSADCDPGCRVVTQVRPNRDSVAQEMQKVEETLSDLVRGAGRIITDWAHQWRLQDVDPAGPSRGSVPVRRERDEDSPVRREGEGSVPVGREREGSVSEEKFMMLETAFDLVCFCAKSRPVRQEERKEDLEARWEVCEAWGRAFLASAPSAEEAQNLCETGAHNLPGAEAGAHNLPVHHNLSGAEAGPAHRKAFSAGRWQHFFECFRCEASRKSKLGDLALDAARYTFWHEFIHGRVLERSRLGIRHAVSDAALSVPDTPTGVSDTHSADTRADRHGRKRAPPEDGGSAARRVAKVEELEERLAQAKQALHREGRITDEEGRRTEERVHTRMGEVLRNSSGQLGIWTMGVELGKGANGLVYQIQLWESMEFLALKKSRYNHAAAHAKMAQETTAMERLEHPHIVRLYHSFSDGGYPCMIVEYCGFGPLSTHIQSYAERRVPGAGLKTVAMPMELVKTYTRQLADALQYIHARSIVHCDVKPANVLMTGRRCCKLTDFGEACVGTLAGLRDSVGTFGFQAPEAFFPNQFKGQIRSERDEDQVARMSKIDVWSLACVVVEMVTGQNITEIFLANLAKQVGAPKFENIFSIVYNLGKIGLKDKRAFLLPLRSDELKALSKEVLEFLDPCFDLDPARRLSAREMLEQPFLRNTTRVGA